MLIQWFELFQIIIILAVMPPLIVILALAGIQWKELRILDPRLYADNNQDLPPLYQTPNHMQIFCTISANKGPDPVDVIFI